MDFQKINENSSINTHSQPGLDLEKMTSADRQIPKIMIDSKEPSLEEDINQLEAHTRTEDNRTGNEQSLLRSSLKTGKTMKKLSHEKKQTSFKDEQSDKLEAMALNIDTDQAEALLKVKRQMTANQSPGKKHKEESEALDSGRSVPKGFSTREKKDYSRQDLKKNLNAGGANESQISVSQRSSEKSDMCAYVNQQEVSDLIERIEVLEKITSLKEKARDKNDWFQFDIRVRKIMQELIEPTAKRVSEMKENVLKHEAHQYSLENDYTLLQAQIRELMQLKSGKGKNELLDIMDTKLQQAELSYTHHYSEIGEQIDSIYKKLTHFDHQQKRSNENFRSYTRQIEEMKKTINDLEQGYVLHGRRLTDEFVVFCEKTEKKLSVFEGHIHKNNSMVTSYEHTIQTQAETVKKMSEKIAYITQVSADSKKKVDLLANDEIFIATKKDYQKFMVEVNDLNNLIKFNCLNRISNVERVQDGMVTMEKFNGVYSDIRDIRSEISKTNDHVTQFEKDAKIREMRFQMMSKNSSTVQRPAGPQMNMSQRAADRMKSDGSQKSAQDMRKSFKKQPTAALPSLDRKISVKNKSMGADSRPSILQKASLKKSAQHLLSSGKNSQNTLITFNDEQKDDSDLNTMLEKIKTQINQPSGQDTNGLISPQDKDDTQNQKDEQNLESNSEISETEGSQDNQNVTSNISKKQTLLVKNQNNLDAIHEDKHNETEEASADIDNLKKQSKDRVVTNQSKKQSEKSLSKLLAVNNKEDRQLSHRDAQQLMTHTSGSESFDVNKAYQSSRNVSRKNSRPSSAVKLHEEADEDQANQSIREIPNQDEDDLSSLSYDMENNENGESEHSQQSHHESQEHSGLGEQHSQSQDQHKAQDDPALVQPKEDIKPHRIQKSRVDHTKKLKALAKQPTLKTEKGQPEPKSKKDMQVEVTDHGGVESRESVALPKQQVKVVTSKTVVNEDPKTLKGSYLTREEKMELRQKEKDRLVKEKRNLKQINIDKAQKSGKEEEEQDQSNTQKAQNEQNDAVQNQTKSKDEFEREIEGIEETAGSNIVESRNKVDVGSKFTNQHIKNRAVTKNTDPSHHNSKQEQAEPQRNITLSMGYEDDSVEYQANEKERTFLDKLKDDSSISLNRQEPKVKESSIKGAAALKTLKTQWDKPGSFNLKQEIEKDEELETDLQKMRAHKTVKENIGVSDVNNPNDKVSSNKTSMKNNGTKGQPLNISPPIKNEYKDVDFRSDFKFLFPEYKVGDQANMDPFTDEYGNEIDPEEAYVSIKDCKKLIYLMTCNLIEQNNKDINLNIKKTEAYCNTLMNTKVDFEVDWITKKFEQMQFDFDQSTFNFKKFHQSLSDQKNTMDQIILAIVHQDDRLTERIQSVMNEVINNTGHQLSPEVWLENFRNQFIHNKKNKFKNNTVSINMEKSFNHIKKMSLEVQQDLANDKRKIHIKNTLIPNFKNSAMKTIDRKMVNFNTAREDRNSAVGGPTNVALSDTTFETASPHNNQPNRILSSTKRANLIQVNNNKNTVQGNNNGLNSTQPISAVNYINLQSGQSDTAKLDNFSDLSSKSPLSIRFVGNNNLNPPNFQSDMNHINRNKNYNPSTLQTTRPNLYDVPSDFERVKGNMIKMQQIEQKVEPKHLGQLQSERYDRIIHQPGAHLTKPQSQASQRRTHNLMAYQQMNQLNNVQPPTQSVTQNTSAKQNNASASTHQPNLIVNDNKQVANQANQGESGNSSNTASNTRLPKLQLKQANLKGGNHAKGGMQQQALHSSNIESSQQRMQSQSQPKQNVTSRISMRTQENLQEERVGQVQHAHDHGQINIVTH